MFQNSPTFFANLLCLRHSTTYYSNAKNAANNNHGRAYKATNPKCTFALNTFSTFPNAILNEDIHIAFAFCHPTPASSSPGQFHAKDFRNMGCLFLDYLVLYRSQQMSSD